MKKPKKPPKFKNLFEKAKLNPDCFIKAQYLVSYGGSGEKYLSWDKLRYHNPPGDINREEWWMGLKIKRYTTQKKTHLRDVEGVPFTYNLPDPIQERLHQIDSWAGGSIDMPGGITNPDTRKRYIVSSLIEEAITSSQLEGAATTRQVAKDMIRTGRAPRDPSEQMIQNNYNTMARISRYKDSPLSPELVFDIHRSITENTLEEHTASGRFRLPDERVVVSDMEGEIFHDPPPAEQLEERMKVMCQFANGDSPDHFIHPVIRSIILHFWLAYDHPFVDGNGRTARALFYWSMLRNGFWLFEFISISRLLLKAPASYARSFLDTEVDENDLTFFLLYQIDIIHRSIKELHKYIRRKSDEMRTTEILLRKIGIFNHRQQALISHALRHSDRYYTIEEHRRSHRVTYQTARTDLLRLVECDLFLKAPKIGKKLYFNPVQNLKARLGKIE